MADVLRSLGGIFGLLGIAWLLSLDRRAIRPRVVLAALGTQIAIGALILFVPAGKAVLSGAAIGVNHVLEYGNKGIEFMFAGLVSPKMFEVFGGPGFVFALRVLPAIIFVTALISVLYHIGVMRWIVKALGTLFQKVIGVSQVESFSAVATIFLGQSEMPAAVKPFVRQLRGPELFAILSSGMASVAGSVLAGYAGLGVRLEYLIAASFMAVPGGLLFAKIICPSSEPSRIAFEHLEFDEVRPANMMDAAAGGAAIGLRIAVDVGAMVLAFVGLIALVNGMVGGVMGLLGHPTWNLEAIMGALFSPVAWMIGVPWESAAIAGNLLGQKLILNEFVAYIGLAPYLKDAATVTAAGLTVLDAKTVAILSFALCGFANFSSIAILAGAFGAILPPLRSEVARYGLRVVAAATLSNLMSATIAGLFIGLV